MTTPDSIDEKLDKILGVPDETMTSWQIEALVKAKAQLQRLLIEAVEGVIGDDEEALGDSPAYFRNQLRKEMREKLNG